MRDYLCNEEDCREDIAYHYKFIERNKQDTKSTREDIKQGIRRRPRDNQGVIDANFHRSFRYYQEILCAKYSIGGSISSMEEDFVQAIYYLEHVGEEEVNYLGFLRMISLGILLETDKDHLKRISKIVM